MQRNVPSHVHVERVAYPRLIARFIEKAAGSIFVPDNQVGQAVQGA